MAPPRRSGSKVPAKRGGESAYQRRIRLYLERHPGATRQEARGHGRPAAAGRSEYQQRIENAQRKTPGLSKRAASGHGTASERQALALLRAIRRAHPDTVVSFLGLERQPDGTWRVASFDLMNGELESFEFGGDALRLLPTIADRIADAGLMVLGARYLQQMVEWAEAHRGG